LELFFAALIGLTVVAVICYPLFRGGSAMAPGARETALDLVELEKKRDITYAAIKELDFDHQMGKLSGEDYRQIKRKYEEQAVAVLEEIDRLKGKVPPPSRKPAPPLCPGCGRQLKAGEKFCSNCGQGLSSHCPGCGGEVKEKDKFCNGCGQALARG
jgi:hypothetical protein